MSLRERASRFLARSGLGRLISGALRWQGTLVLCYHRIGSSVSGAASSATAEAFEAQLELIRRRFDVVAPSEVAEAARERRGRFAAITFDDGSRDGFEVALPVLRAHRVPAGFFVATGYLDHGGVPWWDEISFRVRHAAPTVLRDDEWLSEPLVLADGDRWPAAQTLLAGYKRLEAGRTSAYLEFIREAAGGGPLDAAQTGSSWLTWEMARELRAAGMEIGGHSVNHPVLAAQPPAVQRAEIEGCADRIEAELGAPMRLFSYPVGLPDSFDDATRAIVDGAGVELAFSCYGGLASQPPWDPLDVRRVPVGPRTSPERFRSLVDLPPLFAGA